MVVKVFAAPTTSNQKASVPLVANEVCNVIEDVSLHFRQRLLLPRDRLRRRHPRSPQPQCRGPKSTVTG